MSISRRFAVGIVSENRIVEIAERHVSLAEAAGFLRGYNRVDNGRYAVILRHPISRAIATATAQSRSS